MPEKTAEKSYVTYRINGITGIQLEETTHIKLVDDKLNSICVNEDLSKVTIYIRDGDDFHQTVAECERFIYKFLLCLILQEDAVVGVPQYKVESIFQRSENEDKLTYSAGISIKSSISAIRVYDGETFLENVLKDQKMFSPNNELLYKRLFSIMKNPDRVTKFLALYEFLLDLVSKEKFKKEQKNVSDFIKRTGFDKGMNRILFYPKKRKNASFKEDIFTYYRNEIAHAEFENEFSKYEDLASKINSKLINKLIEVINCAINET